MIKNINHLIEKNFTPKYLCYRAYDVDQTFKIEETAVPVPHSALHLSIGLLQSHHSTKGSVAEGRKYQ